MRITPGISGILDAGAGNLPRGRINTEIQEVFIMENKSCNTSIQCSVNSCAYHSDAKHCCTLPTIQVGCCDTHPTKCEGTECASFKLGK